MTLKAIVSGDEFKALAGPLQAEYKETKPGSGKYVLDVSAAEGFALEDVVGLKSALGKERTTRETLEAAMKAFEGVDPAKAREALAALADLQKNPLEDKVRVQVEAREKLLKEKFEKDLKEKADEATGLRGQLEDHLVVAASTTAIAKHEGVVPLLLPHVKGQIKVSKNAAGKLVATVVDESGTPRISLKSGSTEPMSIDELVESMKTSDVYAPAFKGSKASGTGATNGGTGGGGGTKRVSITDAKGLSANIDAIADGKVEVVD